MGSVIAYMDGVKPFTSTWLGSSSTALVIDVLGLAVVIDARVSRKVQRDTNKRITRKDPRPFF